MAMDNDQAARFLGLHSLGTMKAGQRIRSNLEKYLQRGAEDNYKAVLGAELMHRDKEDDDTFVAVAIKYNVPGLEAEVYKPTARKDEGTPKDEGAPKNGNASAEPKV